MDFAELFRYAHADDEPPQPWTDEWRPQWLGPPEDELGVAVPLARVLARSENGVIALSGVAVHSSGAVLDLVVAARGLRDRDANNLFHVQHVADPDELDDGFVRVGIELADRSRASNLVNHRSLHARQNEPEAPVLVPCGGGGGSAGRGRVTIKPAYWLWPLPPPGPLRLVVEWPLLGIELTTTELDAAPILQAASTAQKLWPD